MTLDWTPSLSVCVTDKELPNFKNSDDKSLFLSKNNIREYFGGKLYGKVVLETPDHLRFIEIRDDYYLSLSLQTVILKEKLKQLIPGSNPKLLFFCDHDGWD